jgi:hypothetical protein
MREFSISNATCCLVYKRLWHCRRQNIKIKTVLINQTSAALYARGLDASEPRQVGSYPTIPRECSVGRGEFAGETKSIFEKLTERSGSATIS